LCLLCINPNTTVQGKIVIKSKTVVTLNQQLEREYLLNQNSVTKKVQRNNASTIQQLCLKLLPLTAEVCGKFITKRVIKVLWSLCVELLNYKKRRVAVVLSGIGITRAAFL
jgi:hypothetical protein